MIEAALRGLAIGIGATMLFDLWAILLHKLFGTGLPNWKLVGRWVAHLGRGTLFHDDIARASPVAGEAALGWAFHYAVGAFYGLLLVLFAGPGWLAAPRFLPAFVLGIATVGAGWFLLAPGMGAGWAASKAPNPMRTRGLNLVAHTVFAAGLYGSALLMA